MSTNASNEQVENFKEFSKKQGENLLLNVIPEKIMSLNLLLNTPDWKNDDLSKLHQDICIPLPTPLRAENHENHVGKKRKFEENDNSAPVIGTDVFAIPGGMVPSNTKIVELIGVVKPKIQQLLEDSNVLKMWILYMIPKIEDGNNFGVSVQEDTLAEVQTAESEAVTYLDQISRYHHTRGKLITKVAKYPHVNDYRCAVSELDEKQFLCLWLVIREIRNRYCTLHDIVVKNLDKIKKPRNSNTEGLY